ncbi:MAG: SsrA-binding protein SmpB [Chloroflexi bacterium]|nr:SsrA-binding protein SmpB [Chloroflexota bacterium]
MAVKTITTNRKAYHNYHVGETIEAGLSLTGTEVKSIRAGMVNLSEAYVRPDAGELWLLGAHIARYDAGGYMSHTPTRARKLLLHRKEIRELAGKVAEKGLTLVPLRLYMKDSLAKLEVGVARGKKLYDKRETLIRRETDIEMARAMKSRREDSGR